MTEVNQEALASLYEEYYDVIGEFTAGNIDRKIASDLLTDIRKSAVSQNIPLVIPATNKEILDPIEALDGKVESEDFDDDEYSEESSSEEYDEDEDY
jgi:hypothetical protein